MTKEHDHNKFVYDGGTKTSPKRFEEWIADKHPTPLYKAYASAGWNAGWQAAIEYQAALAAMQADKEKQ